MIIDAHLHITEEDVAQGLLGQLKADNLYGLVCGTDPLDAARVAKLVEDCPQLRPSYGLHPWQAERFSVLQMEPFYRQCTVIGEIGLDSVWCNVDRKRQREIFGQQLEIAQAWKKPVLLHTKGQEKEVLNMVKGLTVPILLHWYSTTDHLPGYLNLNSYFTVGPDVHRNEAVQQLVEMVPVTRLLVESDGLDAVEWATGQLCPPLKLKPVLRETMSYISRVKGLDVQQLERQMETTAQRIMQI